jgi:predicted ATPase
MKGNNMTEQEFKSALDEIVLKGVNSVGSSTVLGALAIVTRFTEIIYDMEIVSKIQSSSTEKGQLKND